MLKEQKAAHTAQQPYWQERGDRDWPEPVCRLQPKKNAKWDWEQIICVLFSPCGYKCSHSFRLRAFALSCEALPPVQVCDGGRTRWWPLQKTRRENRSNIGWTKTSKPQDESHTHPPPLSLNLLSSYYNPQIIIDLIFTNRLLGNNEVLSL